MSKVFGADTLVVVRILKHNMLANSAFVNGSRKVNQARHKSKTRDCFPNTTATSLASSQFVLD